VWASGALEWVRARAEFQEGGEGALDFPDNRWGRSQGLAEKGSKNDELWPQW